jgi:molecular chaperone GrpE
MTRREHQHPADDPVTPAGAEQNGSAADPAAPATEPARTLEGLQAQLDEERNRANGYLAQWQRAAADLQNYKRRTEQEREDYALFANKAIIMNLLPSVDDLDRALANVDPSLEQGPAAGWVEGIRAIQRKLKGALEASGVTELSAEGEPFDPNIHEAIGELPGEHGKVIQELRRGYRLGSRVLRPALVMVGNGQEQQQRQ